MPIVLQKNIKKAKKLIFKLLILLYFNVFDIQLDFFIWNINIIFYFLLYTYFSSFNTKIGSYNKFLFVFLAYQLIYYQNKISNKICLIFKEVFQIIFIIERKQNINSILIYYMLLKQRLQTRTSYLLIYQNETDIKIWL